MRFNLVLCCVHGQQKHVRQTKQRRFLHSDPLPFGKTQPDTIQRDLQVKQDAAIHNYSV